MEIRDAREADAPRITDFAAGDVDPAFLQRERTVRVAVASDSNREETEESASIVGFLAYDVSTDAVHVTRVGGDATAIEALLDDVLGFAGEVELPLEAVVPTDGSAAVALEAEGFAAVGGGPRFQGQQTTRYRYELEE